MSVAADDTDKYVCYNQCTDRQTHDVHVFTTDFMFIEFMTNIICYTSVETLPEAYHMSVALDDRQV